MTTATETTETILADDACPSWCGGAHLAARHAGIHPDDQGVTHLSPFVDRWDGQHEDSTEPITVRISGFRHDSPDREPDWADEVEVDGSVHPGFVGGVSLCLTDARRLGHALLLAADLMEGKA